MGFALIIIGALLNIVGSLIVLWVAFKESFWWGVGCIFIPLLSLYYVATRWQDTKNGFLTSLAGFALLIFGVMTQPAVPKVVPQPAQEQPAMVSTTTHATFESVTRPAPQPPPPPVTQTEEPVQPVFAQVWADNRTHSYYPKDCASHPESAYLLAKSAATSQGFKPAQCR